MNTGKTDYIKRDKQSVKEKNAGEEGREEGKLVWTVLRVTDRKL